MNKQTLNKGAEMLAEIESYEKHKQLLVKSFMNHKKRHEELWAKKKPDNDYVEPIFSFVRNVHDNTDSSYAYHNENSRVSLLPEFCNHEDIMLLYLSRLDNKIAMLQKKFDNFEIIDELPD